METKKYKEFVVYKITNIDNGKSYIGITTDYKKRIREHFGCNGNCKYLYRAISIKIFTDILGINHDIKNWRES